jgi:ankyrin repeat protein
MTPLHIAAHRGNAYFATGLLDAGVGVDPFNLHGNTPLWVAIMHQRRSCPDGSMIRLLLDHGADPTRSEGHISPLNLARDLAEFPPELLDLLEQKSRHGT